jgi:hypothetical protein
MKLGIDKQHLNQIHQECSKAGGVNEEVFHSVISTTLAFPRTIKFH